MSRHVTGMIALLRLLLSPKYLQRQYVPKQPSLFKRKIGDNARCCLLFTRQLQRKTIIRLCKIAIQFCNSHPGRRQMPGTLSLRVIVVTKSPSETTVLLRRLNVLQPQEHVTSRHFWLIPLKRKQNSYRCQLEEEEKEKGFYKLRPAKLNKTDHLCQSWQ